MKKPTLAVFALLAVQTVAIPDGIAPDGPDLTVKTRSTTDSQNAGTLTTTLYRQGVRQRRDIVTDFRVLAPGGATMHRFASTTIVQCDERRTLLLNEEAKTYAILPIDPLSGPRVRQAASRPPEPEPTGGDVFVTVDAIDTGERRTIGGYIARRVVTTTKTEPAPGAAASATEAIRDGWYIDLPSPSCQGREDGPEPFAFAIVQPSNAPRDRVHIQRRGTARGGYPIEEIGRHTDPRGTTTFRLELLAVSEARLAAAVFAVPAGYRPALPSLFGGYDLTKPDTVTNRLQSYWEALRAWTGGRRRFLGR